MVKSPSDVAALKSKPTMTPQRAGSVDLIFKDINVSINKKPILDNVSGMAKSGTMLAVMGPSGAGKSTLLNVLSGRVPVDAGNLSLNGKPINKAMRRKICYVLQQDLFFADLTLEETLTYTAILRLPDKLPHHLMMERLNEIVDVLELRKCFHTRMGDMFNPGLSGGEKKRASIACELLTNPSIMLLDEPTSGLDSAIAHSLMSTLKRYSEESNKTVVTTIHQPSSSVFYMFDNILLMCNGQTAYFGKGTEIMDFFANVGLHCALHYNPADFILEQVKGGKEVEDKIIEACNARRLTVNWPQELRSDDADVKQSNPEVVDDDLPEITILPADTKLAAQSEKSHEVVNGGAGIQAIGFIKKDPDLVEVAVSDDLSKTNLALESALEQFHKRGDKWPTSWWTQYKCLTRRAFNVSKSRILSKLNLFQNVVLSVWVGLFWFQLPRTEETGRDRLGVMFFSCIFYAFNPIFDAITSFPAEKGIIDKERAAGSYRLSAYYFSKMTSELPLVFTLPTFYIIIVYWMAGFMASAWHFFAFMGLLLLSTFSAQSIGLFLGVLFPAIPPAITAATLFMMFTLLAGGFYTQNLPYWMNWCKYLSFINYTFNAVAQVEFAMGDPLACNPPNTTAYPQCMNANVTNPTITGEEFLERQNMDLPLWIDIIALLVVMTLFRGMGYIVLRTIRKPK